ncbi:MAG: hypothetical protein JOZ08_11765 [Verrucomicrobia bacterium]|nr:hypothetical protein [Verrucomicrobiota bacterium]
MRAREQVEDGKWLSSPDFPWLVMLLALLGMVYLPCLMVRYAFMDDYALLYEARENFWQILSVFLAGGRPFFGYPVTFLYSQIATVDNLWIMRLIGLIGLECLAVFLFWFANRSGWSRLGAFILSAGVLTLPAWTIYVSWAICCLFGFAWVIAGIAVALLDDSWQFQSVSGRAARAITSVVLIVFALFTYQPAACAIWFFFVAYLFGKEKSVSLEIRCFVRVALCFLVACGVFYLLFKMYGRMQPRAALDTNFLSKLIWFFKEVVPRGFSFGWLGLPDKICRRTELVLVGATLVVLRYKDNIGRLITIAALLPCCLVLGFTASIVSSGQWPTFRSTVVVYSIVFVILAFVLVEILQFLSSRPIAQKAAAGLVVFAVCALAAFNLNHYVVYPQVTELAMVTSQVRRTDFNDVNRILVVPALDQDSVAGRVFFDEFGQPSTAKPWVWQPIVRLVMKKVFPQSYERLKQIPIAVDSTGIPSGDPHVRIFNFHELQMVR